MCIICSGLDNKSLTPWEAADNLTEMAESLEEEHLHDVYKKITHLLWLEKMNICIYCSDRPCKCEDV